MTDPVQYVALSYCWGTTKQPGTTQSNLTSRQRRIDVSELPKTLQDAILVTQALDFQYIWIDSVCIVQDDANDWAIESSKMADIYSAAWLIIAATGANDCAAGFLQHRSEPHVLDWTLPSETSSQSFAQCMTSLKVTARITTSHDCFYTGPFIGSQPLSSRAWAMQERELARRIVHFLPDEILWHCQTKTFCECGLSPSPGYITLAPFSAFSRIVLGDLDRGSAPQFGHAWIRVIESYSGLDITQLSDTLPALSGIARYVEHLDPGQYIAGMWQKDIATQLAWYRRDGDRSRQGLDCPSFSWISARQHFRWWEVYPKTYRARCTFVTATQLLATVNPYGHILECFITLQGRTIQGARLLARIKRTRRRGSLPGKMFAVMDDRECDLHRALLDSNANTDRNENVSNRPSVVCFELYQSRNFIPSHRKHTNKVLMTALMLQRLPGETSYTRIGVVTNIDLAWFDKDGVEETITIK
jgi:hypothetical protein